MLTLRNFLRSSTLLLLAAGPTKDTNAQTRVITDDLTHFWEAHDRIVATTDTAEQRRLLHTYFIDRATPGQQGMFAARRYTPDEYLRAIRSYPRFWASLRPHMEQAGRHAQAMSAGVERLRKIHPQLRPADIYFTVGVFRSGGTVMNGMVLIGSEITLADSTTVVDELPAELGHLPTFFATNNTEELPFLNVHELVHTQQPGRWGYDLLSQSLHEGIAEFITTLAMERPSAAPCILYGDTHTDEVRKLFEEELFAYSIDRWIWNDTSGPFPVRDMGYYVGYAMGRQYHRQARDKQQAVADLITLNCEDQQAVEDFAERTGWLGRPMAALRASFAATRPQVVRIGPFANGSRDVDAAVTEITMTFDRPLATEYRSTGQGELGEAARIPINAINFAPDGRSVTYQVTLAPGRRYQFILEEGYRDPRNIQLVPYTVDFSTREL